MKKLVFAIGICTASALLGAAPTPFSQRLSAEEFVAAGLGKLAPAEVARLDAWFAKYSTPGAVGPAAKPVSTTSASATRVGAPTPNPTPQAKAEEKPASGGMISTAKNIFKLPAAKPRVPVVESQIDGWFDGWRENTTWTLKDGTRWRADRHQSLASIKPVKDPQVKIYPAAVSGFWLELPELDQKVRVLQLP